VLVGVRWGSDDNRAVGDVRFDETIRLPQPWLGLFAGYGIVATGAMAVAFFVLSLTAGERVVVGLIMVVSAVLLVGAPLWFVAMHVVVDGGTISRRIGHRRRQVAIADVAGTRIETSQGRYGIDRLVLCLDDGSEYPVATRKAAELAAAIHPGRAPRIGP
jgi:hypothetical protein